MNFLLAATEHLSSMFEKLEISSGVTPVLSIKSQVEEIRDSFFASKLWLLGQKLFVTLNHKQ